MMQVRLAQAITLVVYGHDEAPHPIAPTMTRDEISSADTLAVTKYVSDRYADEVFERELGRLVLGGEGG